MSILSNSPTIQFYYRSLVVALAPFGLTVQLTVQFNQITIPHMEIRYDKKSQINFKGINNWK